MTAVGGDCVGGGIVRRLSLQLLLELKTVVVAAAAGGASGTRRWQRLPFAESD